MKLIRSLGNGGTLEILLGHFVVFLSEGVFCVLFLVGDVIVNLKVGRQLDPGALLLMHSLVYLDNAGYWSAINIFIVIKHHVELVVNHANSMGH